MVNKKSFKSKEARVDRIFRFVEFSVCKTLILKIHVYTRIQYYAIILNSILREPYSEDKLLFPVYIHNK